MRPQMDQVMAADSRRTATQLSMGNGSNLPAFPEEEQVPLTSHRESPANKSVESVNEQDVAGVGTGYGRGPGSTGDHHRSLPPIPRRQGSQASEYYSPNRQPSHDASNVGYHQSRENTPSQSDYPRRQNSDYTAPYVPNMYSVQRPHTTAPQGLPLAFPTPQSAGAPARSPTYPPIVAPPMTAPMAAPAPWVPPLRDNTASPYAHQSTPFQPRHQQSASMPYGQQQQQSSVPALEYAAQQQEPAFGARQFTRSPQPWLPPVETGPPVTRDQGMSSFHDGAAAATGRHRHTQSETTHYAPSPFASRTNAVASPQYQHNPGNALSPPMEVYESYYNPSPTAIPYAPTGSVGPSPTYHTTEAQPYQSYGGNAQR